MAMRKKTIASEPKASRPHMPGYGMPTGAKGLLKWTWAEERLRKSHNYYLMTVRPDGTPHAMPVWGIWADHRFYFSTGAKRARRSNSPPTGHASSAPSNPPRPSSSKARRRRLIRPAQIAELSPAYAKKYKGFTLDPKMGPIFKVRPKAVFGLREKTFKSTTRWLFHE